MTLDTKPFVAHSYSMGTVTEGFSVVEVRAVITDPSTQSPVVLLQPLETKILLPIWVGHFEGQAIAMAAERIEAPRPLTHDLLLSVMKAADLAVEGVQIHTLEENVFFASISVVGEGNSERAKMIDSRPSDAIALALKAGAPILVSDSVLAAAQVEERSTEEALRLVLEKLRPEDLGEYEM
jgi:bifunctional DNase/RNase